jgi:alkanesulfonate monooxygenase SsuD/methylene tetrahydromethanopterin reductase-like flavin-dependent oxidoreductase (luciferase family)
MNAGASPVGKAFAIRNCDALFISTNQDTFDSTTQEVAELKGQARAQGREIDVYTVGAVACRPTTAEAQEYYRYCTFENADWAAVDNIMAMRGHTRETLGDAEFERRRRHTAHGLSGLPLVGDPDTVARDMARLGEAGLRGIAVAMTNYADELPFFADEVLPRLERAGLRSKT